MSSRRSRAEIVPNANDPRVLIRMIGLIAAGLRRPQALAEVLDVELRTVHYYTQAGEWLGLLSMDGEVHLSRHGLDLAFADPNQRLRLYAEAVWRNPFARALLSGHSRMPDAEAIAAFILGQEPELAASTARRRASAVRSLLEPAFDRRPSKRKARGAQLGLPFPPPPGPAQAATRQVDLRAGLEQSPDVYARVLLALLDQGELTTSQLRALLDRVGGGHCPLGPYAEMAVRRGDARRLGDRLVVTPGAVRRREVADDGVLVALTDPDYRRWLQGLVRGAAAEHEGDPGDESSTIGSRISATDIIATRDQERLGRRFATWDVRVFGQVLDARTVRNALLAVLPGRDPLAIPMSGDSGAELPFTEAPFIELLDQEGLPLCFPSALTELAGGVASVNALLGRVREGPSAVRLPGPVDRRARVHGGLLHPGEALPRAIPDNRTLRLRLLTHTPAISIYSALLLMDRRPDLPLRVVDRGAGPEVRWGREKVGELMPVMDAFCRAQGWLCSRPVQGGLTGSTLEAVARMLGICTRAGRRLVLEEALFVRLQEDVEARLIYEAILPLVDRLQAWLDEQQPRFEPDEGGDEP